VNDTLARILNIWASARSLLLAKDKEFVQKVEHSIHFTRKSSAGPPLGEGFLRKTDSSKSTAGNKESALGSQDQVLELHRCVRVALTASSSACQAEGDRMP
jgi:hypothetical protein